jgi:hypothetical protein
VDEARADYLVQRIRKRGIPIRVFNFTTTSVGLLASSLIRALRTRSLQLPKDTILRDELLAVRIRENSAGVARLDHDSAGHDDHAVACALAVFRLTEGRPLGGRPVLFDDEPSSVDPLGRPFRPIVSGRFVGTTAMPDSAAGKPVVDDREEPATPAGSTAPSPFA